MGTFNVNYNAGGVIDEVKKIRRLDSIDSIENIKTLDTVKEVGKIKGFATKTQPFNTMRSFDIPALPGDYEFEIILPDKEIEILALSLTCSGYGEDDHYDLYVNSVKWFEDWYCSEVKEGLFLGTSTYVYSAPALSTIKLIFKNDSQTSKKIWLGIRMLVD